MKQTINTVTLFVAGPVNRREGLSIVPPRPVTPPGPSQVKSQKAKWDISRPVARGLYWIRLLQSACSFDEWHLLPGSCEQCTVFFVQTYPSTTRNHSQLLYTNFFDFSYYLFFRFLTFLHAALMMSTSGEHFALQSTERARYYWASTLSRGPSHPK